jgi:Ca2+-binding EF-hand superfamily protein
VYDDRPHDGKMDIGEFAQLVHDLAPRLGKGKKGGGGGGGGGAGSSSARLPPGSAAARAADVRSAFEYYDRNRSGFLDYRELRNALAHMGYEPTEAAAVEVLRAYDDRADGKMDVGEFTRLVGDLEGRRGGGKGGAKAPARASAATDKARADAREKRLRGEAARAAFKESDRNRSGYLDVRELRGALGQMGFDVSEAAAAEVLRAYDDKPDGLLDVHEFTKLVHDLEARKAAGGAKPKAAAAAASGGGAARATSASVGRQTRARRLRVAGSPPLEGDESGEEEPPQRVAGPLSAW